MESASVPTPLEGSANPPDTPSIAAPAALRQAHLRDESYAKAVGCVDYALAILIGVGAAWFVHLTVLHLSGRIQAPWSVRSGWIAHQVDGCLTAILGFIAGYGMRRLRPWVPVVQTLFMLGILAAWPSAIFANSQPPTLAQVAATGSMTVGLMIPMLNLWDLYRTQVFAPQYQEAMAVTRGLRVKAKLPRDLKFLSLLFLGISIAIIMFAQN